MTPLRYAVEECSDTELVLTLLDYGADPDLENGPFSSPMQYVVSRLSPCADPVERARWETILERMMDD